MVFINVTLAQLPLRRLIEPVWGAPLMNHAPVAKVPALVAALLFILPGLSRAQSPDNAPIHVLELDGTNSFVELPPDAFTNLTVATVEAWVRWENLRLD